MFDEPFRVKVFSPTGVDNCCHVFKQEIQEATSHVYSAPFPGSGEHTCMFSLNVFNYPSVELTGPVGITSHHSMVF